MDEKKFDPKKLKKLNNPQRLIDIPVETIWEQLDLQSGGVFVEIGAGTAFFSVEFLQKGKAEKLYACDLSQVMIDWMNENVVGKFPAIVPIKTSENEVPLKDELADLVFMINLHHELEEPLTLLHEAARLTAPNGRLLIIDWKKKEMAEGPPARIRCATDQVELQLEKAGFEKITSYDQLEKHFVVIATKGE